MPEPFPPIRASKQGVGRVLLGRSPTRNLAFRPAQGSSTRASSLSSRIAFAPKRCLRSRERQRPKIDGGPLDLGECRLTRPSGPPITANHPIALSLPSPRLLRQADFPQRTVLPRYQGSGESTSSSSVAPEHLPGTCLPRRERLTSDDVLVCPPFGTDSPLV